MVVTVVVIGGFEGLEGGVKLVPRDEAEAVPCPRQRAAVVLTDLLGFPSTEAAQMLGIRASTLRMHTSRARAALKGTMVDD